MYKYQVFLQKGIHLIALVKSIFYSFLIMIFFAFVFKLKSITENRLIVSLIIFFLFLAFLSIRIILLPSIFLYLVKIKKISRRLLIIGAGEYCKKLLQLLSQSKKNYFEIIGLIDDNTKKTGRYVYNYPILGTTGLLDTYIKNYQVSDLLIAINNITHEDLLRIIDKCRITNTTIHVASTLYKIIPEKLEIEEIAGTYFFRSRTNSSFYLYERLKRIFDVVLSLLLFLLFLPLLMLVILSIIITSRGPIIYKTTVIGKNEMPFTWYKFRSMKIGYDDRSHKELINNIIKKEIAAKKLTNDPRITRVGKWLRKFSLDELPQLINVFKGEMSLVGPRPKLLYEFQLMESWQKRRFTVTPGITGVWQIRGRNEVRFNDEIIMDLYYINNRSIKFDIEILFKTIPVVLLGKTGK